MSENRCVMFGEIIPEGRQVCIRCEVKINDSCMVDCSCNHRRGNIRSADGGSAVSEQGRITKGEY